MPSRSTAIQDDGKMWAFQRGNEIERSNMAKIIHLQPSERQSVVDQKDDCQTTHLSREKLADRIVLLEEALSVHVRSLLDRLQDLCESYEKIQDPCKRRELQKMTVEKREILVRISAQLESKVKTLSLLI
jgi:hypothetical protein